MDSSEQHHASKGSPPARQRPPPDYRSVVFKFPAAQPTSMTKKFKLPRPGVAQEPPEAALGHQRTLLSLFQGYMVVVMSLLLIYALYYACLHLPSLQATRLATLATPSQATKAALSSSPSGSETNEQAANKELAEKVQLLTRYVELIAVDLEETKSRLQEREKCHCAQSCSFNGTQHSEGSSWQHQCDTCTCQAGKISCNPIKCPASKCQPDESVQLAGQCCPTCMRRCKYNATSVKHGAMFKPSDASNKQCKCHDGLIKCQAIAQPLAFQFVQVARLSSSSSSNKRAQASDPTRPRRDTPQSSDIAQRTGAPAN